MKKAFAKYEYIFYTTRNGRDKERTCNKRVIDGHSRKTVNTSLSKCNDPSALRPRREWVLP